MPPKKAKVVSEAENVAPKKAGKTRKNAVKEIAETVENGSLDAMAKILDDSQRSVASHTRSLSALAKLYQRDPTGFFPQFIQHLNKILLVFKKEACVDRLLAFISSFVTQPDLLDEQARDAAVEQLLTYLVTRASAKDKAVRYRVCQLISMVVEKMGDEAEISDELFQAISDILMQRSTDQAPVVRATSVEALHRLQEDSKDDPVVAEMARRMQTDSSKEVRVAALRHLAVNPFTLDLVLERLKDVSEQVRSTAYRVLRERAQLKYLSSQQRAELVSRGLKDRIPAVREECIQLIIHTWLPATDNDMTKLCLRIRPDLYPKECELLMKALVERNVASQTPALPFKPEDLTLPKALYWRVKCEVLLNTKRTSELDEALPDTVELCNTVRAHKHDGLLCKELIGLCHCVDLQDEAGRAALISLMQELLGSSQTAVQLLPLSLALLRRLVNLEETITLALEIISDIRDPLQSTNSSINCSNSTPTRTENFVPDTDEREHDRWLRVLTITKELLQLLPRQVGLTNPGIAMLLETIILPSFRLDAALRAEAVACLGLFAMLDRKVAEQHLPVFDQALSNDNGQVQLVALQAIFDIVLIYGEFSEARNRIDEKEQLNTSDSQSLSGKDSRGLYAPPERPFAFSVHCSGITLIICMFKSSITCDLFVGVCFNVHNASISRNRS